MTTSDGARVTIDPGDLACAVPIPEDERVILGHGSGGQLSASLMREVLGPALAAADDTALLRALRRVDADARAQAPRAAFASRAPRCSTPNRCCSSTTASARSENATLSWSSACVPTSR